MMALPEYPAYSDSALPWVPFIPTHWTTPPNRALLRRKKVLVGKRHSEYQLLSLTKQGVIVRDISTGKGKFSADMGTSQEVRAGDLVFCLFDVPETPRTVGLAKDDGMITGAYTVFECRDRLLARFLDLFYRSMDDRKLLSPLYSGLRNTIPPSTFLGTKTPLPPPDEQAAIVRYLDHMDRRIAAYIRAKQKLIALLDEEKQAIIHHAVTRGLNPDAKLKASGIPWLGEIPEHWEVIPARHLFRAVIRRDRQADDVKLSVTQRHGLVPTTEMEENSTQAASFDRFLTCHPGDLVLNKYKAHLGVFWAAPRRGLITPNYTIFRTLKRANPRFYEILYHTPLYKSVFAMTVYGVTEGMSPLYTQDFYQIPCLAPPPHEQEEIVGGLIKLTERQTAAMLSTEDEIALIREYRTRLIADVVTGQLDVREAAKHLPGDPPEEPSEPEPIEEEIEDDALATLTE